GRISCAASHHFRRVVFQDQHRRFARHARDLAVNELVGNQVADDEHAAAGEAVDEPEEPLFPLRFAGQRMNRARDQHVMECPSIQLAAPIRLSAIASARSPAGGRPSSVAPYPVLTKTPLPPTSRASATSSHRSPTTYE